MLQLLQLGKLLYYVINNECSNANWTEGGGEMYATLRARLCDLEQKSQNKLLRLHTH